MPNPEHLLRFLSCAELPVPSIADVHVIRTFRAVVKGTKSIIRAPMDSPWTPTPYEGVPGQVEQAGTVPLTPVPLHTPLK